MRYQSQSSQNSSGGSGMNVSGKAQKTMGLSYALASILSSVGTILPRSIGSSLIEARKQTAPGTVSGQPGAASWQPGQFTCSWFAKQFNVYGGTCFTASSCSRSGSRDSLGGDARSSTWQNTGCGPAGKVRLCRRGCDPILSN